MPFSTVNKWFLKAILIVSFVSGNLLLSQTIETAKVDSQSKLYGDAFGNIYLQHGVVLSKYSKDGLLIYTYEDFSFGNITYTDITDPMKIMVYYQDYQQIVFLDRTLSVLSQFSLIELGFFNVEAIAHARDDRLWVYDLNQRKLVLTDETGNVYVESANVLTELNLDINPNQIIEYNNEVFLKDASKGIFVFDRFCTYVKALPILTKTNIHLVNNKLFYFKENQLNFYNLETLNTGNIQLESDSFMYCFPTDNNIHCISNNQVKSMLIKK